LFPQFKAVDEAQPRRASNLARFVATVIANFGLSLSILKVCAPLTCCRRLFHVVCNINFIM